MAHNLDVFGIYRVSDNGIPGVEENTKGELCEVQDLIELYEVDDNGDEITYPGYNVLMLSGPDEGMEFYVTESELEELEFDLVSGLNKA